MLRTLVPAGTSKAEPMLAVISVPVVKPMSVAMSPATSAISIVPTAEPLR